RERFRRRVSDSRRLSGSVSAKSDRRKRWLHAVAADPLLVQYPQPRASDAGAFAANMDAHRRTMSRRSREEGRHWLREPGVELARHRRPGPRCCGTADLWIPDFHLVRTD